MEKLSSTAKILIVIAVLASMVGMFFPSVSSTFTPYYGSIAKHIVVTNNWTDLVLSGHDWLDKPHLPFWLTALSYKAFGINSFAYILPGFVFNLIGVYYTYRLARFWYSKEVGVLAALFTVTALHIMLSSIDVRAEAYLLGEIMPACYYWLKFDRQSKLKYLIFGAFFTGLALMTKGIFIIVTIMSGLSVLWIYHKQWKNFISVKWLGALVLSFIFAAPELIALYQQFNMHPEKVVFGHDHVSGIRWFFWDSQFGRFFNTGPIMTTGGSSSEHWVYFVHTFLWAYLPWWPMFVAAIWSGIKKRKAKASDASIYLFASFFVTFLMFTATKFQVDHYTNIIFPFASIICAKWLVDVAQSHSATPMIFRVELGITVILMLAVFGLSPIVLAGANLIIVLSVAAVGLVAIFAMWKKSWLTRIIAYPTIAMSVVFVFAMFVNGVEYAKYDAGYQMARYLNQQRQVTPVIGYKIDLLSLDLHTNSPYMLAEDLAPVTTINRPFYLVTKQENTPEIEQQFPSGVIVASFAGGSIETYLHNAADKGKLNQELTKYIIVKVD